MVNELVRTKSHTLAIPSKWQERFIVKRINDEDIEVSIDTRNAILERMANGERYVQIGKTTLMINSIRSIEPKWGEKNMPPRPKEVKEYKDLGNGSMTQIVTNQEEIKEWDSFFKEI
jgi:hypothetical protein